MSVDDVIENQLPRTDDDLELLDEVDPADADPALRPVPFNLVARMDEAFKRQLRAERASGVLADPLTSHCHECGELRSLWRLRLSTLPGKVHLTVKLLCAPGQGCRTADPRPRRTGYRSEYYPIRVTPRYVGAPGVYANIPPRVLTGTWRRQRERDLS